MKKASVKQLCIDVRYFGNEKKLETILEDVVKSIRGHYGSTAVVGSRVVDSKEDWDAVRSVEWCSNCENEVEILMNEESTCPCCGESILPCSMCGSCVAPCPFNKIKNATIE